MCLNVWYQLLLETRLIINIQHVPISSVFDSTVSVNNCKLPLLTVSEQHFRLAKPKQREKGKNLGQRTGEMCKCWRKTPNRRRNCWEWNPGDFFHFLRQNKIREVPFSGWETVEKVLDKTLNYLLKGMFWQSSVIKSFPSGHIALACIDQTSVTLNWHSCHKCLFTDGCYNDNIMWEVISLSHIKALWKF